MGDAIKMVKMGKNFLKRVNQNEQNQGLSRKAKGCGWYTMEFDKIVKGIKEHIYYFFLKGSLSFYTLGSNFKDLAILVIAQFLCS